MIKILFVCHGNICRSPMAEYMFKDMVRKDPDISEDDWYIESAAVSREEIGNDIYPPAKAVLRAHGVPFEKRRARQMTREDYRNFDVIYVMDDSNARRALEITGGDPEGKIRLLLERGISDPWYTGEFESTYSDIAEGCRDIPGSI